MAATRAAMIGRIGGYAVALGIGGAVATGFAGHAAAAPDSSAPSASQARGSQTAKPVSRAVAARGATTSRSPSRRSVTPPAPVAAAVPIAALRRSAAVRPGVAAATPTAAAQLTPSDIWSSLMTRVAGIFGWDPRGRLQTIYKGTHFTIPNNFGFFVQNVSGSGTFTTNTTYDLGDSDQWDWNKLTGIAFTPLEPDRDSAMVGWRYNLETQLFEIAPFYNVNKVRILPNENPLSPGYEVISVPADQTFSYTVDYTGVTISYGDRTVFKPFPQGLTPNVWTAARVSGWFGGNEAAPRTVSYYLKLD
ncbi:MAG: hypothetical protein ACR2JI_17615 [Mycobacterium sp.]